MKKFSKNKKLNGVLNDILESLEDLGVEEVKHYYDNFRSESDYNLAQYGNLLVYYSQVKGLYARNGYKTLEKWSDEKVWETYRRQVGYIARYMLGE